MLSEKKTPENTKNEIKELLPRVISFIIIIIIIIIIIWGLFQKF